MKNILATVIVVLAVQALSASNKNNQFKFVNLISAVNFQAERAENKILIISTRNFTNPETLELSKGVHPENKRFFFIAGTVGDSTIVTYYQSLEKAMQAFGNKDNLLVYVNGYNKTFDGTVYGGQKMSARYNLNMVMFDWPTDQRPIRITAKNARKVSASLAVSLNELHGINQNGYAKRKLSLVFHSMGNHVARHLVKSGNIELVADNAIDNIILNAAAVKSYDHNRWVERLKNNDKVYIVMNKQDYVLRGASIFRGVRQLGNVALGDKARNAEYVDFSDLADKEHSYYLGQTSVEKTNPALFHFYNLVFNGNSFVKGERLLLVSND